MTSSLTSKMVRLVVGSCSTYRPVGCLGRFNLTAVAALLTPKPKAYDDPVVNIKRPDNIGNNRFTPTFGFNSIQELARLGQTVPLVFADQIEKQDESMSDDGAVLMGGTRANSLLTYSMVSSTGGGQSLRVFAAAAFIDPGAENYIAERPEYVGLAFGDNLVQDFNPTRVAAYFRGHERDGRILMKIAMCSLRRSPVP